MITLDEMLKDIAAVLSLILSIIKALKGFLKPRRK
jgi:hypothetical protein